MNEYLVMPEIEPFVTGLVRRPTTIWWNRLEGEPRARDFSRALKAEVRDPLWMITRQWQMGEFIADDAGSPITAKIAWSTDQVQSVGDQAGGLRPYDGTLPLETVIEARPVPMSQGDRPQNALLRLGLGRRWRQMLVAAGHGVLVGAFTTAYGFDAPNPNDPAEFDVTAHPAPWQMLRAIAGRALDGGALLSHIVNGGDASEGLGLGAGLAGQIDALGTEFTAWARRQFVPPDETLESWVPRHLEYRVSISVAEGEQPAALAAPDYRGGRLDWFNFDAVTPGEDDVAGMPAKLTVQSFLPTIASFEGMPNTRHWTFEEGAVSFGAIRPDTTDLAKLIFIEFGLVYANDWFLLPITLPVGSLTRIAGLTVTNTFGERFWIDPAVTEAGPEASWRMFRFAPKGRVDDRLFLPATTPAPLESRPVEAVAFVRDEVANMVWGMETRVQLADGLSYAGRETALETHRRHLAAAPPPASVPATDASIRYRIMRTPAEHWIPFIPVHVQGDNLEIQLQRAALPRLLPGDPTPDPIPPRTQLLREGLDAGRPYFVAEEEVERAGRMVEQVWQRCRWRDGRTPVWLSQRVKTGRGEASSGLSFDTIEPNRR